jgi:hypothetical protein
MQRVLYTMDERLRPELVYQLRDGSFNSLYGFCDPFVTGRRRRDGHVDLVEQRLGIGGHCHRCSEPFDYAGRCCFRLDAAGL